MVKNIRPKGLKTSRKVQKKKITKKIVKKTKQKKKRKKPVAKTVSFKTNTPNKKQTKKLKSTNTNSGQHSNMSHAHAHGGSSAIANEPTKQTHHAAHRHHDKHHLKVAMTPETKVAMQAITSPFKVHENESKIPDGLGGESFATTDKLRKSENTSVWLNAIRKAQTEFETFSSALICRLGFHYVPTSGQIDSFPVNVPGALASVYHSATNPVGWPFLAINAPVTPFYSTRTAASGGTGIPNVADGPITMPGDEVVTPDISWKNISVENVYYFTLPGTLIDITRGALGGPLNNYVTPVPSFAYSEASVSPPTKTYINPVTAREQEVWRDIRKEALDRFYPMNLSAPMQVYRVLDFTFEIPGTVPPSTVEEFNLPELVEAMRMVHPEMATSDIIKAVGTLTAAESNTTRYRAQIITPLAGVTDWKDFSSQLGKTLNNATDFVMYPPNPTDAIVPRVSKNKISRKRASRTLDIEDCDEFGEFLDIKAPMSHDNDYYPLRQSNEAGPMKNIFVESDFTYSEGHNGIQTLQNLDTVECTTWTGNGAQTGPYNRTDVKSLNTISAEVVFEGSLVAARRTVGFGMKLFSTEAAITANGRIAGGELPISLVTELLNYQDTPLSFPEGAGDDPPAPIWKPTEDRMAEWAERIESRLEDYNAYRAIDGCTVRYNPLQTEAQSKFVYTKAGVKMNLEPVQIEGRTRDGFYGDERMTALANLEAALPQIYEPASDGSEMVPVLVFSPADPIFIDEADPSDTDGQDGMFLQCVLHTENHTTNQFPLCTEESIYDPNWDLYCRICSEPENFPIVVEGHSFKSFFKKVGAVTQTAVKFGAKAIEVGEVMLPLLSML
jgi:hypothetical protein